VNSRENHQCGFTFVEVVVVVAIIGILASIGTVSLQSMMNNSTSRAALQSLNSTFLLARAEAIKRGGWVRLCGSTDGSTCDGNVSNGWLVYHDRNASGVLDDDEETLLAERLNPDRLTVNMTKPDGGVIDQLAFDYRGFTSQNVSVEASKGDFSFELDINRIGRIALK